MVGATQSSSSVLRAGFVINRTAECNGCELRMEQPLQDIIAKTW
jgi:hypothetical protein